jgi:nicotinamidase/pyrazinamidase
VPEALIVVDFQNDFTPGGALAVPEGDAIAERVNTPAADPRFDLVVAARDWHPPDHGSFTDRGGPWLAHCVQGALDALRQGFEVTLDTEGVRGVDVSEGDSDRALDELRAAGATVGCA